MAALTRALLLGLLVLASFTPASAAYKTLGGTITTQTTTTLLAGVSGKTIDVYGFSFCVDGNGATTSLTLRDSSGTNLIGTGYVVVLTPGQCWGLTTIKDLVRYQVGTGLGLQLVTGTGNGPVEWAVEVLQP